MTSSLVGSEMCIRDRCFKCVLISNVWRLGYRCRYHVRRGGPGAKLPEGAVSYTHLTLPTICSV
eukprot:2150390-Prorocentrum_lima.AAC.1